MTDKWFNKLIPESGGFTYGANFTHKLVTALPIVLVNLVAFSGQLGWAHDHLKSWHFSGQVMFALALESIAVYLAYSAYLCEKRNDSALRLKLASYSFALVVAAINYSHFAVNGKPTAVAIVVAMMSAISPWLWAIYSRQVSRGILFSKGLIDEHALRLGNRWIWHPIKSFKVMYNATWMGINKPDRAIAAWEENERKKAYDKAKEQTIIQSSMNGNSNHPTNIEIT